MNATEITSKTQPDSGTIDVVADSNYSTSSDAYIHAVRAWRNDEKNEYAFHCRKREKEAMYVEGKGYHVQDPAVEERRAMLRINLVLGIAMLAYLLMENFLPLAAIGIGHAAEIEIGYSYSDGIAYGNQTAVLILMMTKTLLTYLVPIGIFRLTFRMPRRAAYHWKPDTSREIPVSLGTTMLVFAVANAWLLFAATNVLRSSTMGEAYYTVSYMRPAYQVIYMVFELVTVSVLKEIMLHGEALHVLRQFGDWYAVLLTAMLGVCASHSAATIMMELTLSLVTGIAVLRSGSLLPAAASRMLYHLLVLGMFGLEVTKNPTLQKLQPLLLFCVLLIGVVLCVVFIRPSQKSPGLLQQTHYLSSRERLRTLLHLGPLTIIFILCIVLMIVEVII